MSQQLLESQVDDLVRETLEPDAMEEVFCGLIHNNSDNDFKKTNGLDLLKKMLASQTQQDTKELALRFYVHSIFSQFNSQRSKSLFDILEHGVQCSVLQPRMVCEALLHCEDLCYQNSPLWCQTFKLLRKIIGGVDYKGCRDLLRVMLEKAQTIPNDAEASEQINVLEQVVQYILDRNTCLLPSYFVVNELTKLCSDNKPWPHWAIGKLLAQFIQSFRPTAQMVTGAGRTSLKPVVGYSSTTTNAWKLNPTNLRFPVQGPLPYNHELLMPQTDLLRYVIEQPYSRDMVITMFGLNKQAKQRCIVLEEQLVDLIVLAMERSENEDQASAKSGVNHLLWQHLSSQLIFFVLSQFASFPHMVMSLYDKLQNLRKGRDHLMWVLLQFISGSIQKNPLSDFLPVMKLYDLLYPEKESHPVPELTDPNCTHVMAATCIWIHLYKKAESQKVRLQRPIPNLLHSHISFLKKLQNTSVTMSDNSYTIALLCNAYSTNPDYFSRPLAALVESIYGNNQTASMLPGNISASAPIQPLPMSLLDSLTVHAKMSLIHQIVTRVMRVAQNKTSPALAPAVVETYARLLVYTEIESLGIKGFISQLLPSVFKSSAWGILHTLLEMFSYRLHHIQPHYRVQLLSNLNMLNQVQQTNNQLHLCVESTSLRLITGLGSAEVQPQLSRFLSEPKNLALLLSESEELNRALVLTLARAMAVTGSESISGSWCKELLTSIMQQTPHSWSSHTLECFPSVLADFFRQNNVRESKSQLKNQVQLEFAKWKRMNNENDSIAHFTMQGNPPLFICILWKCLVEDNRIISTAYKVLDRLGSKALSQHLRTFADFLVCEFCTCGSAQVQKYVDVLGDLVWKCNIVPIDKLVLTLALRNFEGNEAQVCYFIIQRVLLKPPEFKARVNEFVTDNSPEHWLHNKWHEKHMAFHQQYPERFNYEGVQDLPGSQASPQTHPYLPIYFGNVCLRFLPVFDIVIHRMLELPQSGKLLELLLDHLGKLYKFHDRPLTYLFNTLHYYDRKLKDRPSLKKKLLQTIVGAYMDVKPNNWCLTEDYQQYMQGPVDQINWVPEQSYYRRLVSRLVDTIDGKPTFGACDWRFNEFPNAATHALHASCIELMALPVASSTVGNELLDIILKWSVQIQRTSLCAWMNATGLLLTALPESYWSVINDRIVEELVQDTVLVHPPATGQQDIFKTLNFEDCFSTYQEQPGSILLALVQASWHHASIGQLSSIPQFIKERLKPILKTEEQFIFICHMIGPFLQRLQTERTRCLMEVTVALYELLEQVDASCEHLKYLDPISDFLYHIKYKLVGDGVKNEIEKYIRGLRPALQLRLRFISYQSKDDIATPAASS